MIRRVSPELQLPKNVRHDLTGQKFGRFLALRFAGTTARRQALWLCLCECGNERVVPAKDLRTNNSQSCGCLQRGMPDLAELSPVALKDPNYPNDEARALSGMRQRCNNPKTPHYKDYGGRGIRVKFRNVFELVAAIGRRPTPQHSVDRIDNDGDYEVGNVRWATRQEQSLNTRTVRRLTVNSKTKTLHDWGRPIGCSGTVLASRLRRGWCEICTISQPKGGRCTHRSQKDEM